MNKHENKIKEDNRYNSKKKKAVTALFRKHCLPEFNNKLDELFAAEKQNNIESNK